VDHDAGAGRVKGAPVLPVAGDEEVLELTLERGWQHFRQVVGCMPAPAAGQLPVQVGGSRARLFEVGLHQVPGAFVQLLRTEPVRVTPSADAKEARLEGGAAGLVLLAML